MPRVRSRPCEPAGSPFPFPHFPTARSYFFLYPAVLPAIPRATFPASICPAGRQGQRHFLCRLHGRRSSALPFRPIGGAPGTVPLFLHPAARHRMPRATFPASFCPAGRQGQRRFLCRLHGRRSGALPFRPIGGAPGTAPLFLHPAARGTDAARPFPPMRTGGQSLPFSTFSYRPVVLLSLPSRPASDTARHFSCILLSRRAAGTAPLSLPPAWAAERCAPFSPYRRRARHCTSFSTPRRPGNGCRASVPAHANRRAVPSISTLFRAHPALPGGGHARLIPPAPARGCSRRISPSISAPLCLPRSPLLCARPFRAGFFGSALPCSPPPRAVSGPVPARADASRRSFAFSHARRAPFLPCAPCAPGLCASRRGDGRSASPARPACVETTRSKSPARQRIPARPACMPAPRTPGASVPPRTPGASVPPRAAVRFGSHSAVQSLPIFFHRPAGKRTQKANLIRTYVRIRF